MPHSVHITFLAIWKSTLFTKVIHTQSQRQLSTHTHTHKYMLTKEKNREEHWKAKKKKITLTLITLIWYYGFNIICCLQVFLYYKGNEEFSALHVVLPYAYYFSRHISKLLKHLWVWIGLPGWETKEWKLKPSSSISTRETGATGLSHGGKCFTCHSSGFGCKYATHNCISWKRKAARPLPKSIIHTPSLCWLGYWREKTCVCRVRDKEMVYVYMCVYIYISPHGTCTIVAASCTALLELSIRVVFNVALYAIM